LRLGCGLCGGRVIALQRIDFALQGAYLRLERRNIGLQRFGAGAACHERDKRNRDKGLVCINHGSTSSGRESIGNTGFQCAFRT